MENNHAIKINELLLRIKELEGAIYILREGIDHFIIVNHMNMKNITHPEYILDPYDRTKNLITVRVIPECGEDCVPL